MVETVDLRRSLEGADGVTPILKGLNLRVDRGEMLAIMGPSGSGKSTLLNILGCLDRPSSGTYRLEGVDVGSLDDDALADLRNQKLGFVFQGFNLLPRTSALENVILPMLYDRTHRYADPEARARAALEQVGLGHRMNHHPNQLSGGQQQRVAVARALVTEPALLIADEPTGNLDSHMGQEIMALFASLHAMGRTLIIVTHEPDIAAVCSRIVVLKDGQIVEDRLNTGAA
ncbi:MAG TPA: ABC transporter ATP-binding protein [Myxococcota bacterium]|nr:ABC transporter ATP-binding protein [Myxococcota bacterium]